MGGVANINLHGGEILAGFVYIVSYVVDDEGAEFLILNPTITNQAGVVPLDRIPATLTGRDAGSVGGLAISTDADGTDADTLYFRTNS